MPFDSISASGVVFGATGRRGFGVRWFAIAAEKLEVGKMYFRVELMNFACCFACVRG